MILILDNYDSFTYNLYQMLSEHTKRQVMVVKHDALTVDQVLALDPKAIVISPGPGTPNEAGISLALIKAASGKVPILGICLGHQCIAQAFGGTIIKAPTLIHGKADHIIYQSCDSKPPGDPILSEPSGLSAPSATHYLFNHLPPNFIGVRYHSLAVSLDDSPTLNDSPALLAMAYASSDKCLMALRHRDHPTFGLQFHPESFGTPHGHQLLKNFLDIAEAYYDQSLIQTHIS